MTGDPLLLTEGHYLLGVSTFWQGALELSRQHLRQALTIYSPGRAAQHLALFGQDPKAVIAGGSKPDAQWEGSTAMHGAANRGAPELVDWLAAKGVPLDTTSQRGLRPYHHAAGLDGFLFHASPESVQRLMALAKARGETIDLSEPPASKRPGSLQ